MFGIFKLRKTTTIPHDRGWDLSTKINKLTFLNVFYSLFIRKVFLFLKLFLLLLYGMPIYEERINPISAAT